MATLTEKLARELGIDVADLRARIAAPAPAAVAVASQHYVAHDLPCTATPPCSRKDLRTAKRAATHGVEAGGHTAR